MLLVAVAFAANPAISILFATFAVKIPAAHGASQSAVLGFCLKDGRREALETIG